MTSNSVAFDNFFREFSFKPEELSPSTNFPECPLKDVCKLFRGSTEILKNHGLYKWKDEFKTVVDRCVVNYTRHANAPWTIRTLLFRIVEAIKSIFGVSEWQKARREIHAYLAAIMSMGSDCPRPMNSWEYKIRKGGEYQMIADIILRNLAELPPPEESKSEWTRHLYRVIPIDIHRRLTWDLSDSEYINIMQDKGETDFQDIYLNTFGFDISRFA